MQVVWQRTPPRKFVHVHSSCLGRRLLCTRWPSLSSIARRSHRRFWRAGSPPSKWRLSFIGVRLFGEINHGAWLFNCIGDFRFSTLDVPLLFQVKSHSTNDSSPSWSDLSACIHAANNWIKRIPMDNCWAYCVVFTMQLVKVVSSKSASKTWVLSYTVRSSLPWVQWETSFSGHMVYIYMSRFAE